MEILYILVLMRLISPTAIVIISIYALDNEELPKYRLIEWIKSEIEIKFKDKNLFGRILGVFKMIILLPSLTFFIWFDLQVFITRLIFFIWFAVDEKRK